GEIRPVPADRVVVVGDDEIAPIGGRTLRALYTPGHASHHIAYHDVPGRLVFTGDVAGVRIPPAVEVWPPTPPPDIDIAGWHASIARLRDASPDRLLLTHFGPWEDVSPHLDQLATRLDAWVTMVEQWAAEGLDRDEMIARLGDVAREEMERNGTAELEPMFELTTPHWMSIDGLLRFLRKQGRIPQP
ncbi:MAG TPA: MBL fold metallo-hydrolase, partial [Thermomicrobiales bacterium]|nr:MBL fold metallo-hydrolase [Thermomicrobiales bacterium]